MSGNSFGEIFRITTFGESHGPGLGVVIDGVPANVPLALEDIQREMDRRRPGQSAVATQRREADCVEILSGWFEGKTTGTALSMLIRNTDQRSRDYGELATVFRPGHADYGYFKKYGLRDYRGGGRSSGRETAARVAAGAVAKLLLRRHGIEVYAGTVAVGNVRAACFQRDCIEKNPVRCPDPDAAHAMEEAIYTASRAGDSVGGIVECHVLNLPPGLGEPVFDKLDALLAHAMLSLGGIKGIEFGDGFVASTLRGSENNDAILPGGFASNHAGGVCGGLSTGQELLFRVAVKPTPSIALLQKTVDESGVAREITIGGRHDPCLCPRLVPVVEAMTALVLVDLLLRAQASS